MTLALTKIFDRSENSSISRFIPTNAKKSNNCFEIIGDLNNNQVSAVWMMHPVIVDIWQIVSVSMSFNIYFQNLLPFAFDGSFNS